MFRQPAKEILIRDDSAVECDAPADEAGHLMLRSMSYRQNDDKLLAMP